MTDSSKGAATSDKAEEKHHEPPNLYFASFVIAHVFLIDHQLVVSSRHCAAAFKIPPQYVGIYFAKLTSLRSFTMVIGSIVQYFIAGRITPKSLTASFMSFVFMFFLRIAYLIILYQSTKLAYHVYTVLIIEGLFSGFFQMSFFTLLPQCTHALLSIEASAGFVLSVQVVLDLFLYSRPLSIVMVHSWISALTGVLAAALWLHHLFYSGWKPTNYAKIQLKDEQAELSDSLKKFECKNFTKYNYRNVSSRRAKVGKGLYSHFPKVFSAFSMLFVSSFLKNFLFPAVIPYGLLEPEQSHIINVFALLFCISGSLTIYFLNNHSSFFCQDMDWKFEFFWILAIPQALVFGIALSAIHTKVHLFRMMIGSKFRVMLIISALFIFHSHMKAISNLCVMKYVFGKSQDIPRSILLLTYYRIANLFYRFLFTKLSVGYNYARIEYEFSLTPFYPTYKLSLFESFMFWVKVTISRAYLDTTKDLTSTIKEYL